MRSYNGFDFNLAKCDCVTFGKDKLLAYYYRISRTNLSKVTKIEDFGMIVDSHLTLGEHIYSILSYGSVIWTPSHEYQKYESTLLNISNLESSRKRSGMIFVYKLSSNRSNCP